MQIWFDATAGQKATDECKGDCSRDEIDELSFSNNVEVFSLDKDRHFLRGRTLFLVPSLHIQWYSQEQWIICNPIGSGRIAVLDSEAMEFLETFRNPLYVGNSTGHPLDIIEKMTVLLWELGFLQDTTPSSRQPGTNEPQVLVAWMHITNACNLLCPYCYLHKTSEHMVDDTSRRAVDAIFRSARKQKFKRVTLKYAGGEASLHIAQVIAIHDYALQLAKTHNLGLHAFLLSNGVALSQRVIEMLKLRDIGVMISLDGIGAFHDQQRPFIHGQGSFKYVNRTIDRLLANGVIPHISVTVSQRNLEGLPDLMQYILDRELPFSLSYYRENDCSAHVQDLLFGEQQMIQAMRSTFAWIEQRVPERSLLGSLIDKASMDSMHRYTCGMGRNYLVIDQNGGVAKCHADILQTVTTIDVEDPLHVIQNEHNGLQNVPVEAKEPCSSCTWRYWCSGGCPLLTYRATGKYNVKSPNCAIYQALFPDVLRLEALRLLTHTTPVLLAEAVGI